MPEQVVVDECPRCQFEPFWDGYELRCPNCDYLIGIRDTVTKTNKTLVVHNQRFHAALRDAYKVLIIAVQQHADKGVAIDDVLKQVYVESREQAEESDGIAAGAEHDQQWLKDILERMEARCYE
jgi:hypothetical protein